MQKAISVASSRLFSATEAGGGTAAIMFGATGGENARSNSIMSMALVFMTQLISFCMFLMFVMSGTWNTGKTSTPLVMDTYATVFGGFGSVVAVLLSLMFGLGVLVGYAFIGRECWLFLTGNRFGEWGFMVLYCAVAAYGALGDTGSVFAFVDITQAALIVCNIYGLMMLLPELKRAWNELPN
jgi:AGCS family alanine or glycine:cation symporter